MTENGAAARNDSRLPAAEAAQDGLPVPRRYWAVAAIWLAMAMSVLDSSIANVALPTIARDVGASPAASIWVVNAYQIAIAMMLLPLASLGEILGYKRVYAAGLVLFVLASIGCTFATSLTGLAICRFVQGFGAAAIMSMNGALVRFTYPKAMLGAGVGYNAMVVAISSAAGPSIAAAILAVASWRWLFAVNVPIGLASLAIGLLYLPATPRSGERFDIRSALLTVISFAALFLVASDAAHGVVSLRTLGTLALGIAAMIAVVRIARGRTTPLVPIDLLGIPILRLSYLTSSCAFAAQMLGLIALPFYLQSRFGYDHVETGLLITALPLGVALSAPVAGRLVGRYSAGVLGGVGLAILALAYASLALLASHTSTWTLILSIGACGIGFGLFQAPNNRTMLGGAPLRRSGAAAGMLATARLVGQTAGALITALLFRLYGVTSVAPFVIAAILGLTAAWFSIRRRSLLG
jgi:DHA2 family multidrug resistance protein-like MFS transporter